MNIKILKKVFIALSVVGPGIFLIGYNIGTGSVVTMAKIRSRIWDVIILDARAFLYLYICSHGGVWQSNHCDR